MLYEQVATKIHGVRVDDETWGAWERAAIARGSTVSMLIRDAVNASLKRPAVTFASDLPELELPAAPVAESAPAARSTSPKTKRRRTGLCEHRNPPDTYCARCDH